jgi:hypothetical protein
LRLFFGVSLAFIFFVVLDCASNAQDSTNSAKPSVDKNKSQAQSASSSPAGAAEKSTTVPKPANPASPLAPAVTAPASTGIQKPSAAASSQTLSSRIEEGKNSGQVFQHCAYEHAKNQSYAR